MAKADKRSLQPKFSHTNLKFFYSNMLRLLSLAVTFKQNRYEYALCYIL